MMLTFLANTLGGLLVAPMALRSGLACLRSYLWPILVISIMTAAERILTNASLYFIGASLKTALHGFNVLFTFACGVLCGIDQSSRKCIYSCNCKGHVLLAFALLCLVGGGFSTVVGGEGDWHTDLVGVLLQLSSSLAYAAKFTTVKQLLGDGRDETTSAHVRPSKLDIALVANPVLGFSALAVLPVFEASWSRPSLSVVAIFAVQVTMILIFELRLTELTSPLTVSVLAVAHNVIIVVIFETVGGESLSRGEFIGFLISTCGCLVYARFKSSRAKRLSQSSRYHDLLLSSPTSHLVAPIPPSPLGNADEHENGQKDPQIAKDWKPQCDPNRFVLAGLPPSC